MSITFAVAQGAPIGVVIAEYSASLSRMWRWDRETDTFAPGQFLKGRAYVADMSKDGRYAVYFALVHQRPEEAFIAISHPPYFTALAYFPTSPISGEAFFCDDGSLHVRTRPLIATWRGQTEAVPDRVEPMCPFKITRGEDGKIPLIRSLEDEMRSERQITAEGYDLIATDRKSGDRRVLASFPREPFQGIESPEWAKVW